MLLAAPRAADRPPRAQLHQHQLQLVRRLLLGLWLLAAEAAAVSSQRLLHECLSSANGSLQCPAAASPPAAGGLSGCSALLLLRRHRLKYCYEVSVWYTLPWSGRADSPAVWCDRRRLERHVAAVDARDREVGIMYRSFASILDRYDCDARYSVMHNCSTCKVSRAREPGEDSTPRCLRKK